MARGARPSAGTPRVDVVFVHRHAVRSIPDFRQRESLRACWRLRGSGGCPESAGVEVVLAVAAVRRRRGCSSPSASGRHGLADQPLHGEQEGPQRTRPIRPGGRIGLRRTAHNWCIANGRGRRFPGLPVIACVGVEASPFFAGPLRRRATPVKRSTIVLASNSDVVVYGLGEQNIVTIAQRLAAGQTGSRPAGPPRVTYGAGWRRNGGIAHGVLAARESWLRRSATPSPCAPLRRLRVAA